MIRPGGIIYERNRQTVDVPKKKHTYLSDNSKDLGGDSGVGQAPEFPSKSLAQSALYQSKHRRKKSHGSHTGKALSFLGSGLIIFSLFGFLLTYGPILRVEIGYRLARFSEDKNTEIAPRGGFADLLGRELIGEPEGVPDPNFSLVIPKIHAKGRVLPNVDAADYNQYMEALKVGVAHARGTQFPGSGGTIYLFAHSTDSPLNILRYNAVFYLLREVDMGDDIYVYFGGVKHRYIVSDKKIVEPTDVSYLSPTNAQNRELLILQTCWPPGTTIKRLLVFAEKPTTDTTVITLPAQ